MKKIIFIIISIIFFGIGYTYSFNLNFLWLWDLFKRKIVWIHFKAGGNDFGWMFFVVSFKNINSSKESISNGITKKTNCAYKLKWYYYNSQHWQILYPLDEETLNYWQHISSNNYKNLKIEGGLYTLCDDNKDSIYWQIKYTKNSNKIFSLQAGFQYNYTGNSINYNKFANNLQTIYNDDTTNIVWLLYDSTYGIWFVWWKVNDWFVDIIDAMNRKPTKDIITKLWEYKIENIKNADINALYWIWIDTNLVVKWLMWLWSNTFNKSNIIKNFLNITKINNTVILKQSLLNIWIFLNKIRKNTDIICRWKWNKKIDITKITNSDSWKILCIKWDNLKTEIQNDLTLNKKVTNIIIKWKNNKLIIKRSQEWPWHINVFISNGYIMFDNTIDLLSINKMWIVDTTNWITSWAVFNGNIFINWLITWGSWDNISSFEHKMYIYGSVWSLNTVWENLGRVNYIKWLWLNEEYVDIATTFKWQCMWIDGIDGVSCGNSNNKYAFNSLIIQKKHLYNPLIK